MTTDQFRRMALSFSGVEERQHMGHPDFRVKGKIFATLQPAKGLGMVKMTPEDQHAYMALDSAAFVPAAGAWGQGGSTLVPLHLANAETVREAMESAWRAAQAKAQPGKRKAAPRKARPAGTPKRGSR